MKSNYSLYDKILAFWKIIRPVDDFVIGLGLIVGMGMAGAFQLSLPIFIYIYVLSGGFLVSAHAMVVNDIIDIEIDLINEPNRPIPSGKITGRQAIIYSITLAVLGIGLFGLVDLSGYVEFPYLWIFSLFHVLLADIYSWKIKKTGIIGNIVVAYHVYALFLMTDLAINGRLTLIPQVIGIMGFFADLSREIFKGIVDTEGDREHDVRTVAVYFGRKTAKYIAISMLVLSILISIYLFFRLHLVGQIGVVITVGIYSYTVYLSRNAELREVSRRVKTWILVGPLQLSPFLIIDQLLVI